MKPNAEKKIYNWLFELFEEAPAQEVTVKEVPKQKIVDINAIDAKTNIADVDAKAIVAAMQNPEANPQIMTIINGGGKPKTPEAVKNFVQTIGPEELVKRIEAVGAALPATGLSKAEMPFLPAADIEDWNDPEDISKMLDAVSPGGQYQIDFNVPYYKGGKEGAAGKETSDKESAMMKEAAIRYLRTRYIREAPEDVGLNTLNTDNDKAEEWLKAGTLDGKAGDDESAVTYVDQAPLTISKMIPTQKNVLIGKSLNFAVGGFPSPGVPLGAYVVDAGNGIEILDGHHRWSAGYLINPEMQLTGHLFNSSIPTNRLLPILSRLGNALGKATKLKESIMVRRRAESSFDTNRWQILAGIRKK